MAEYLIQESTLISFGNAARAISGQTTPLTLSEILACFNNSTNTNKTFQCYVGMMPPNNNVGNDGDIFFLV